MLTLQGVTYIHPNGDLLFSNIDLTINRHDKIALTGNNGAGKSTILKILAGELCPSGGSVSGDVKPYYVPQIFGQFNDLSVAQVLRIDDKMKALREILGGNVTDAHLAVLGDDWSIEERCREALAHWKLDGLDLDQKMNTLSGGQKTRVFLSGILVHQPEVVLLDEPSNHLDTVSRNILYDYVKSTASALMVVSHDRTLLNHLGKVYALDSRGVTVYGGNYDFYAEQKRLEADALDQDLRNKEKALRKAREVERESLERRQKLDARGKRKQEKAGLPTISMNTFRNNAEKSTSRIKDVHAEKVDAIAQELTTLRKAVTATDKMKMDINDAALHTGKILVTAKAVNYGYEEGYPFLWRNNLDFQITSGERMVIRGSNGSGKTTLIKMILGEILPRTGTIERADMKTIYIDQDYSLIDDTLSVYDQAQRYNVTGLQEHEVKIRLNRFLFTKTQWNKPCKALSGGEKMRLMLCCLTIASQAPDMIVLDEPTNNLDIQNMEILTDAINEYRGTLLVVSHDEYFLKQINTVRSVTLDAPKGQK